MKVIIAGSREFDQYDYLKEVVDSMRKDWNITEIICGEADGADKLGKKYGIEHGIPINSFPARWGKFGKGAGYIRNTQMAEVADGLIAFWNGKSKGTKHMIDIAKKKGLEVSIAVFFDKEEDANSISQSQG